MSSQVFRGWPEYICDLDRPNKQKIIIGDQSHTWYEAYQKASQIAQAIKPNQFYVIHPDLGMTSIIALIAITMTANRGFVWAKPTSIHVDVKEMCPGIYQMTNPPALSGDRTLYGTLTSGSSALAKIPMGYADQLPIIGAYYASLLYSKDTTVACCLPLEYSAAFMMALVPTWMTAKNLIIFSPDDWGSVLTIAKDKAVTVLVSPNMLAAACASVSSEFFSKDLTFLTTAGYLSKERVSQVRQKFPDARFQVSYGSTETGIMTLGKFQDNHSVGKPLWGKAIWLREMDHHNIGKITTSGVDCREFYLQSGQRIRNTDGTVSDIDLGHFDTFGNLYLDGRIDHSLKINGQLFYPSALEQHILNLEKVLDVKVTVVKKAIGSESIEVVAVGDITELALQQHCEKLEQSIKPHVYTIHSPNTVTYSDRGKLK